MQVILLGAQLLWFGIALVWLNLASSLGEALLVSVLAASCIMALRWARRQLRER
jgi:hypothetical protein